MRVQSENRRKKGAAPKGKYTEQFPLLIERAKELGFEIPTFQPRADQVVVWRLPPLTVTHTGIIIPDDHQSPHVKGVLIAAGLKAMDSFESEGIELGHIVIFKRFAGWETNDQTPEAMRGQKLLMIHASDIIGSDDLRQDLEAGRVKVIRGEDGRHRLTEKRQISDKKAKVLALAAHPSATPGEKAAAQKIAASLK